MRKVIPWHNIIIKWALGPTLSQYFSGSWQPDSSHIELLGGLSDQQWFIAKNETCLDALEDANLQLRLLVAVTVFIHPLRPKQK